MLFRSGKFDIIGRTRDDAAGEAFDKVARAIGLGYPGGPKIDKVAKEGNPDAIAFPRANVEDAPYDFSFSGLKSAVLNYINGCKMKGEEYNQADIAASFQKAVTDVLVAKAMHAVEEYKVDKFAIAGGVAGAIENCLKEYYPDVPVHIEHAESLAECKKVLTLAKAGKIKNCMIEGMACPGGCIGGAGTNAGFAKTSKALKKYVDSSEPKLPSQELENLELN